MLAEGLALYTASTELSIVAADRTEEIMNLGAGLADVKYKQVVDAGTSPMDTMNTKAELAPLSSPSVRVEPFEI